MIDINWDQFRVKNRDYRNAFEDLCYHLFCREHKLPGGVRADFNQVGLETEPISVKGKFLGFQSKFFDHTVDFSQIDKSVTKALDAYSNGLDVIYIFLNRPIGSGARLPKKITKYAKAAKVEVIWVVPSNFKTLLNRPSNFDIAQFYFGFGDFISFIQRSTNPEYLTLINSREFVELPLSCNSKAVTSIQEVVGGSGKKVALLVGSPGSGKSIYLHKLFRDFAGLQVNSIKGMLKALTKANAVPILVNLKNCATTSLEIILAGRKEENDVGGSKLNFIYLFDGLDELDEERAENTLTYLVELSKQSTTAHIIISCRAGNPNRGRAKFFFPSITEFYIEALTETVITQYFKNKQDSDRLRKLEDINKISKALVQEVRDVLFVKLLWEAIHTLDEHSSLIDLLEAKVARILHDPQHRRYLGELNLPNPKEEAILSLNQEISATFQKTFQFRLPLKALQEIILNAYPRLDYHCVNRIIDYLSSAFFDHGEQSGTNQDRTYIYQHRRYQEFFFVQKLRCEYERHPRVLREWRILANSDTFNNLFLKYLRKLYERELNLPGLLELNLIDTYLGKHQGYGADDAYYMNSALFPLALANQNAVTLDSLFSDSQLELKEKLCVDLSALRENLKKWQSNEKDFYAEQFLRSVWEETVPKTIKRFRTLLEAGKIEAAKILEKNLHQALDLFDEHKFVEKSEERLHLSDPFWKSLEDWFYVQISRKKDPIKYFEDKIRPTYKDVDEQIELGEDITHKEKVLLSFFRAFVGARRHQIYDLIDCLDDFESEVFIGTLLTLDFIPILIRDSALKSKVQEYLRKKQDFISNFRWRLVFAKKFLGHDVTAFLQLVKKKTDEIRDARTLDWNFKRLAWLYGLNCYVLDQFSFSKLLDDTHFRHYTEQFLYAALFKTFVELLEGKTTLEEIIRDYNRYIEETEDRYGRNYLGHELSLLLGHIIAYGFKAASNIQLVRKLIFKSNKSISALTILTIVKAKNSEAYRKLVNKADLRKMERGLKSWKGDFPSYVDRCFELSILYADLDDARARALLERGVTDGILRHGWRKDTIVSYQLVEALDLLWENNFVGRKKLRAITRTVFGLAQRVADITDGKATWRGPYNVVELAAKYDLLLAVEFTANLLKDGENENAAVTALLLGRVALGQKLERIEKEMGRYRTRYDARGNVTSDVYEEKLKVYLKVAESLVYSPDIRKSAFDKAYQIVDEVLEKKIEYAFTDDSEEKRIFQAQCLEHGKEFKLTLKEKEKEPQAKYTEGEFLAKFAQSTSETDVISLMKELGQYENHIVLKEKGSWDLLVEHMYKVCGHIGPIIELFKAHHYPHTDFYSSNSKYLHFAMAAAIRNIGTKSEVLEYLKNDTGHGGFTNMIKSYSVNGDEAMCVALFKRYLKFCEFLVN